MSYENRQHLYKELGQQRGSKVLMYATSDRPNLETQIAGDVVDLFVDLLDSLGPTRCISLILHTNGGHTSTAWRIVNLIRTFCDELEVIIPLEALSAGTLISLGADRIVMTKQAALGPIDPSITHPLNPPVPYGNPAARVPVSVEAVRGYIDAATKDLAIKDDQALATVLTHLADKIHPLVMGQIFRSREQIRFLASRLIRKQVSDDDKINSIIDFLCADSGSHDYTINRREAADLGLNIEKPSSALYELIWDIHQDYAREMRLLEPFIPDIELGGHSNVSYCHVRGLVECSAGTCYKFVSEGKLSIAVFEKEDVPRPMLNDVRTFEGWRKYDASH